MLSILKSRKTKVQELANRLEVEIYRRLLGTSTLECYLKSVADAFQHALPGTGVIFAALDGDSEILCYSTRGLEHLINLPGDRSQSDFPDLARIRQLFEAREPGHVGSWFTLKPADFGGQKVDLLSLDLKCSERCFAKLAFATKKGSQKRIWHYEAVEQIAERLARSVKAKLEIQELACGRALSLLIEQAQENFSNNRQRLVEELKETLGADTATLLVKEQGRLYLSASTDSSLDEVEGDCSFDGTLTSRVLVSDEPLFLFDATDSDELQEKLGLEGRTLSPLTEDLARKGEPHHFLGLRLPSGAVQSPEGSQGSQPFMNPRSDPYSVQGALRITRRRMPFAAFEKRVLKSFAAVLGTSILRGGWEHFFSSRLWESPTEAIALSLHEADESQKSRPGTPKIVAFNEGFEKLLSFPAHQIQGADARAFYAPGEFEENIRPRIANAIKKEEKQCGPYETIIRSVDGRLIPVAITYRIFTSPFVRSPARYVASIIRDRSQEVKEKERLSDLNSRLASLGELLDEMGLAYFQADREGRTSQTSKAECEILRYSEESLMGKPRAALYVKKEDRGRLVNVLNKRGGRLVRTMQRLKDSDGGEVFAKGVIRLLKGPRGEPYGFEGLYEDVSERMRLQAFLGASTDSILKDTELSDKIRKDAEFNLDYMTSLSHQIQTPLRALAENLKDFRDGINSIRNDAALVGYIIGQIQVCTRQAANLSFIDRILRNEAFDFERCNLTKLAIDERLNFDHLLKQEKKRLVVDGASIDKHLEVVWGNPMLLRQVLFNLVDNAIKYSLKGTTIRIVGKADRYGGLLEISNVGIRVSVEDRRKVFDRGFRTVKARAFAEGTGLGLWLAKKIVSAHGGTISCDSFRESPTGPEGVAMRLYFPEKYPSN